MVRKETANNEQQAQFPEYLRTHRHYATHIFFNKMYLFILRESTHAKEVGDKGRGTLKQTVRTVPDMGLTVPEMGLDHTTSRL